MDGDFKGDFTRDSYNRRRSFSRVLMQQGRVQLDADWNEQTDILLRYMRHLARDIIGLHGGPESDPGFAIGQKSDEKTNFTIGAGDYYVDGILVENEHHHHGPITYTSQPYYRFPSKDQIPQLPSDGFVLVYLDVWERQVTYLEDDQIREVALGTSVPDTATRAQVVWQVKFLSEDEFDTDALNLKTIAGSTPPASKDLIRQVTLRLRDVKQPGNRGLLKARAKIDAPETDACIIQPNASYRGEENQLYRVEIHNEGQAINLTDSTRKAGSRSRRTERATASGTAPTATFKWSRENGSVVFPVLSSASQGSTGTITLTLGNLGRDDHLSLEPGDWVEIIDEDYVLQNLHQVLLKVSIVDHINTRVTLEGTETYSFNPDRSPMLRRWDQKARPAKKTGEPDLFDPSTGTIMVVEGPEPQGEQPDDPHWITLEDGVQILFHQREAGQTIYRPGDYWLIPARTAIGDVEWPRHNNQHVLLPPHGVEHHYAPLAIITLGNGGGEVQALFDLQWKFQSLPGLV